MIRLGFIGTGNMGRAIAVAAFKSGSVEFILSNRTREKAEELAADVNGAVGGNRDVAEYAKYIFIAVKPQFTKQVLNEIAPVLKTRKDRFILVSMVAGWTIDRLREAAGGDYPVIRIMPNTPALIGEGMTLYTESENVSDEEMSEFLKFSESGGRYTKIEERLINAASAVTGCGPAFVDMFVDALADGAVACGVPRKDAIEFAAQMVVGSGRLILETGKHPDKLKDEVCSPGGSTIEGVIALENGGFRSSVIGAVRAACEKNSKL